MNTPYQYRIGERVVVTGCFAKDGYDIGVIAVVHKPPSKRQKDAVCLANDGYSWMRCRSFDRHGVKPSDCNVMRPLTDEEREKLDNAIDPSDLTPIDPLFDARKELAEQWYIRSDLNGDQVLDAEPWKRVDKDKIRRTLKVQKDDGNGYVFKTLIVCFGDDDASTIVAAYLPGTNFGQEIEVDGSANWTGVPF